jgi:hypothetical protein
VEIVTYSKLGTHKLNEETIFISAPRDVEAEDIVEVDAASIGRKPLVFEGYKA